MPAPAISGARSMPSSPSTSRVAITQMTTVTVDVTTAAIDVARAVRRGSSTVTASVTPRPTRCSARVAASRSTATTLKIDLRTIRRAILATIQATSRMTTTDSGRPISQSASPASASFDGPLPHPLADRHRGSSPHASASVPSGGGASANGSGAIAVPR